MSGAPTHQPDGSPITYGSLNDPWNTHSPACECSVCTEPEETTMNRVIPAALVIHEDMAILVANTAQGERLLRFLEDDEPMENVSILGSFSREHLHEDVVARVR